MPFRGIEVLVVLLGVFSLWAVGIALQALALYREREIQVHELARDIRRICKEKEAKQEGRKLRV